LFISDYIVEYNYLGGRKSNNKLQIKDVIYLPLHMILFTITWVVVSTTPHLASKGHIQYALECINPMMLDWCSSLLKDIKDHLTRCRTDQHKQFIYGSILVSFFLESVP